MRITTAYELLLFSLNRATPQECLTLPPGTYEVKETKGPDGERWWKLATRDFGNAIDCWKAVQGPADTALNRTEQVSKKIILLLSGLLFLFSFIKTDWAYVAEAPAAQPPSNRVTGLLAQYTRGSVFSTWKTSNGDILVSRYAAGWQLLQEALSTGNMRALLLPLPTAQLHKELLLLLVLVTALLPSYRLTIVGLQFLLPVLLWAPLVSPPSDPALDSPLLFYYLTIIATTAALIWNNKESSEQKPALLARILSVCALCYNAGMLLVLLTYKGWL